MSVVYSYLAMETAPMASVLSSVVHVLVIMQHTSSPLTTVLSVLVDLLENVKRIDRGVKVYL